MPENGGWRPAEPTVALQIPKQASESDGLRPHEPRHGPTAAATPGGKAESFAGICFAVDFAPTAVGNAWGLWYPDCVKAGVEFNVLLKC